MKNQRPWILATAAALVLAACGGDGDSSPAPVSVATAQRHLLLDGGSWTLTGSGADGTPYTMNMTFVALPADTTIVSGAAFPRSQQTFAVVQGGVTVSSGGPTYSFDAASLAVVQADNGDGTCSLATANTAPPASAAVGAGGNLYALSELDGCTGAASPVGTTATTWSLESDKNVVLLCSNSTTKDLSGSTTATLSICVQAAPDGSLGTKARVTIAVLGVSTTVRNF